MNYLEVALLCSFTGFVGFIFGRYKPRFMSTDVPREPAFRMKGRPGGESWRTGSGW